MNREKNSGIVFIKSPGLGDLQILLSNIHHISKKIDKRSFKTSLPKSIDRYWM